MPRRNRVIPSGEIVAMPERGTMMGNRGMLHDGEGHILRPWGLKQWLICVLEFNFSWFCSPLRLRQFRRVIDCAPERHRWRPIGICRATFTNRGIAASCARTENATNPVSDVS
jgi:hypothetical protein